VRTVSPRNFVEPAQWYAAMPTFYVSACIFVTDPEDRVLVVKPNYRPYWGLPGGIAEEGERPDECIAREAVEELGLELAIGNLLAVDWAPPVDQQPKAMINFTFDGGVITDPATIRLQEDELEEFAFLPWDEATKRLPAVTAPRIGASHRARKDHNTVYIPTEQS
jgi:8-oxo-dGTP diphosphatase